MIGRDRSFSILERALGELEKAGAKAGYARLTAGSSELTRFANNYIHQNVAEEDASVTVAAIIGKKLGGATTNRLDRTGISQAARLAAAIAAQAAEDKEFPGLVSEAVGAPAPEIQGACDQKTATLSPASRARLVARAAGYAREKGVVASGKVSSGGFELAVATSNDVRQYATGSSFSAACTAMVDGAAGSEDWSGGSVDALAARLAIFGREAVDTALQARGPRKVDPGEWPVILAPRAVSTLVDFLVYLGFDAQAHQEGRSCLAGRMGTPIVGDKITLRDDGLDPTAMPLPFDYEGVPRKRLTLVEKGVARDLPHNSRTAKKTGAAPTGHSFGPLSAHGALPMHVVMEGGDADLAGMIASTAKGLFVNRFWYTNVAEPTKAVITGMTRDGVFLIENGRVAGPVCNMRFTESVLDALSRVEQVGSEVQGVGGEWDGGVTRVPALKLSAFRFTGSTEF
ncbi:MAG TPA: TldD/PmbA family protein [Planctomycetota bacterium]|nr:TldD/PmbA family protein [Planctomycetota bacterium]